tara:strand:+ start:2692 stop:3480 length:789 start_codon:yes stop_codon:yes gene_type:complete
VNHLLTKQISSEPFRYDGSSGTACYLIHGYTGSTFEFEQLGKFLASHDLTAVANLLPGHGTSVEDCNSASRWDWIDSVKQGYDQLCLEFDEVFVIGFSMGSVLAFHLALERNPSGLIIISPAIFKFRSWKAYLLPIMCRFKEYEVKHFKTTGGRQPKKFGYAVYPLKAGREALKMTLTMRRMLSQVTTPTLVMHSTQDITAPYENGPKVYEAIGSKDKEFIRFESSSHMLMYDCEKEAVWEATLKFIKARSKVSGNEIPVPE